MRLGQENPREHQSYRAVCVNRACLRDFKTDECTIRDGSDHWCSDACYDEWDADRTIPEGDDERD